MLLCWLLFIPFIGGLACWFVSRRNPDSNAARWIALASMALVFLPALSLWFGGDFSLPSHLSASPDWNRELSVPWIQQFGIAFHLGLDGLSLIMVMLASVLGMLAIAASWSSVRSRVGLFHANLLWTLGGVIGIFLAIDLFLYFFFWELMLIPMYFLIALWGHEEYDRGAHMRAAIKFFIYTQTSGLLMLAAILGLVFAYYSETGILTFDYNQLLGAHVSGTFGFVLMLGFFIAFAVKLPSVPFHGWLADTQANSPSSGAADLSGILVKTAAYGLLRFTLPLFPEASAQFAPFAIALGLISIYYGAVMAFAQNDMKRLISYSSISHMGFVMIGLYAGTFLALQGVIVQVVASAISTAALFILAGQLYERMGTRDMRQLGGLFGRLGALPGFALIFVVASLGMPATANFIGEFLILFGAFSVMPWVVVVASGGMILAAVYALYLMHRVYWGTPQGQETIARMRAREYAIMMALVVITLIVGLFPNTVLSVTQGTMNDISHWFAAGVIAASQAS
ncbi:NADH-quinone oxidoreductase subunit M [Salinisphaera sp. Q1T1-3]|uniref:NADH-quinone oxidoreductase subunit M n=1 Tax=Salinisphaera sp. Q1T1-3 TaxID=2321229 RepID=UPI000E726458|nr:NADH-quinone oxidoreductase subunit M [Salinisphaera sp. Q1T1-3]RJS91317.1 NADH-quinone oxidoreductase subunit M [Salinisphaera sp. Q1T1-3]